MVEVIISMILDQLGGFLRNEIEKEMKMVAGVKKEIERMISTLTAIQAVLRDAERKQVQDDRVKVWLENLKEAVYEIEDVLDKWNTKTLKSQAKAGLGGKKVCSHLFYTCICFKDSIMMSHQVGRKIKGIREKLDSIARDKDNYGLTYGLAVGVSQANAWQMTSSLVNVSEVYGRDADEAVILRKLLSKSSHSDPIGVPVISIVGMGGLGKTTLAQLVSKNKNVVKHFDKIMWVCVSDRFDITRLAKAIIEAAGEKVSDIIEWNTLHCLLSATLKDKLFLLVLDDVWTEDCNDWGPLKLSFDGGASGSKILVTTRNQGVVSMMDSTYTHNLMGLTEDNSWSLFSYSASLRIGTENYKLFELTGKAILKKCKGVPLFLKTIGCLLRSKNNIVDWQVVLESEIWNLREFVKGVLPALLLSYYGLPSSWKPCFTYCATFPKGHIFVKDRLIKLWMAHGFVYSSEKKEMEKVGEEYFEGIVSRSLFQDLKMDGNNDVSSCKMHDLVHDFVQFLAVKETYISDGDDTSFDNTKLHHLTIRNFEPFNFDSSIPSIYKTRGLRTLHLYTSKSYELSDKVFRLWPCLRSLDLSNNNLSELPREIEKLIHLRYLNLSNTLLKKLPNSLSNLCNLQTLNLNGCSKLCKLPSGIGNMISLRHLELYKTNELKSLPEGVERLTSLRSLSKFIVGEGRELNDLKGLNLIQGSIEISGLWRVKSANEAKQAGLQNRRGIHALTLDFGSYDELKTLNKYDRIRMNDVLDGLPPHPNLEELKINGYLGPMLPNWMKDLPNLRALELMNLKKYNNPLPSIAKLPLLEVLKIHDMWRLQQLGLDFLGISETEDGITSSVYNCEEQSQRLFSKLIHLELKNMNALEEWVLPLETRRNLQILPCLLKLEINCARNLKVLPALGKLESLEELYIESLHSVKRIGPEFFGISDDDVVDINGSERRDSQPITVFPKLKILSIQHMDLWEEWNIILASCKRKDSFVMPYLERLVIRECPNLKVVPHNIFTYLTVKEQVEFCPVLYSQLGENQIIRKRGDRESYN